MNLNVNHLSDLGVIELSFKIASKRPMINQKEWMVGVELNCQL